MALKAKTKILLFKIETTEGVDSNPTGAVNAVHMSNFKIEPMAGSDLSRELEKAALGADPTVPVGLHCKMSFDVELAGSGTAGLPPAWGPLLRSCGMAQIITPDTSVEYFPITDGHQSATIYFQYENTRFKSFGNKADVDFDWTTQKYPVMKFSTTGSFTMPMEATRDLPNVSLYQPPQVFSGAFTPVLTLNGVPVSVEFVRFKLGNEVTRRLWTPLESTLIGKRVEQLEMKVEAVPVTTMHPYQLALDQTLVPFVLRHGVGAGKVVEMKMDRLLLQRPDGFGETDNYVDWTLRGVPQPSAAYNDQWSLKIT